MNDDDVNESKETESEVNASGKGQSLPITVSLILTTAFTLLVGLALAEWYAYSTSKQLIKDEALRTLKEIMVRQSTRIQDSINAVTKDALLIAEFKEVQGTFKREREPALQDVLRKRTESAFSLMLKTKGYLQIRLIAVDDGMEVVRVERQGSNIHVVSRDKLQYKGDKDYFIYGQQLAKNDVYVSGISLNKEYGKIQQPWLPTQRVSVPIFLSDVVDMSPAKPDGVLVINTDAKTVLDQLDVSEMFEMVLVNSDGDTLYHVDPSLAWGFEFGMKNGYRYQHPLAWEALNDASSDVFYDVAGVVDVFAKVPLNQKKGDFLGLVMKIENEKIAIKVNDLRNKMSWISFLVVLFSVLISALIIRRLTYPLANLTLQVESVLRGGDDRKISVVGSREINALADVFMALIQKLKKQNSEVVEYSEQVEAMNASLEDKVRVRTQELYRAAHEEKLMTELLSKALENSYQLEYLSDTLFYLFDNVPWLSGCEQSFVYLRNELSGGFGLSMISDDAEDCVRMPIILPGTDHWVTGLQKRDRAYYSKNIPCSCPIDGGRTEFGGYVVPVLQDHAVVGFMCFVMPQEIENDGKCVLLLDRVSKVLGVGISKRFNEHSLLDAKLDAEKANAIKSEFLSVMSHEMRTPMNAIMGFTTRLLSDKENLSSRQLSALTMVSDASDGLLTIIEDILDFSKIEANEVELTSMPFLVADIFDAQGKAFNEKANKKGLVLTIENTVPDATQVYGDANRISKILGNLLSNAIKFTDAGELTLFSTYERVPRSASADENESLHITFGVRDTGVGISEEKVNEIFKPFTQTESFTTRQHGGTGLGLAICQKLVELMEGRIWVESVEGQGASFCFLLSLPLCLEQTEQQQ